MIEFTLGEDVELFIGLSPYDVSYSWETGEPVNLDMMTIVVKPKNAEGCKIWLSKSQAEAISEGIKKYFEEL